jgi:hypothetical protein
MCYESVDIDAQLMGWIGVSVATSVAHDLAHGGISNKLVGPRMGTENGQGFFRGYLENIGTAEDRNDCIHWIEDWMVQCLEFSDEKVVFRFIISKADVDVTDLCSRMLAGHVGMIDHVTRMIVECEVVCNERQRASCPFSSAN